jgi:predicted metal-dependent hydrolase
MNTDALLDDLRGKSVALEVRGLTLRVAAPREVVTEELHDLISRHKHVLIRHLERERKRLDEADRRGLIIKWSREPGYVALHDPTTGEWHDVPASGCLPSIVEIAKAHRQRRRQSR